jgi:hypothetical protein
MKLLCDFAIAAKCRKLARKTGVRHAVIDVTPTRLSRRKPYQAVVPYPAGGTMPRKHVDAGVIATLYFSDE